MASLAWFNVVVGPSSSLQFVVVFCHPRLGFWLHISLWTLP